MIINSKKPLSYFVCSLIRIKLCHPKLTIYCFCQYNIAKHTNVIMILNTLCRFCTSAMTYKLYLPKLIIFCLQHNNTNVYTNVIIVRITVCRFCTISVTLKITSKRVLT